MLNSHQYFLVTPDFLLGTESYCNGNEMPLKMILWKLLLHIKFIYKNKVFFIRNSSTKRGIGAEYEFKNVIKLDDRRKKRSLSWKYFDL